MFNIFKSKEQKQIDKAIEYFKTTLRSANAIVTLDVKHYPDKIVRLAEIFNENNTKGHKILYELRIEIGDNGNVVSEKFSHIKNYFPGHVMAKKDFKKFEKVMMEALSGKFGEYRGV